MGQIRGIWAWSMLMVTVGCSDYSVSTLCVEKGSGFDIEEVSVLQDAAGYPDNRDAVVLERSIGELQTGESWNITHIDVLAMVPEWVFGDYSGGDVLTIELYDADSPVGAEPFRVSRAIDVDALEWEKLRLPETAFWAGIREELDQRKAWMRFDFEGVIPEGGLNSAQYTVAVSWASKGLPTIGYSNFNLDCGKNWTDYGDGAWELNSADGDGSECSWPMLRVGVETRTFAEDCDGESVALE
jgi:hypothetical protein